MMMQMEAHGDVHDVLMLSQVLRENKSQPDRVHTPSAPNPVKTKGDE